MKKSNRKKHSVKPVRVISRELLYKHDPDEWAVLLGMLGFSAKAISYETGLTCRRVYYYLRRRGVSVKHYRDGVSGLADAVIRNTANLPLRNPTRLDMGWKLALPSGE